MSVLWDGRQNGSHRLPALQDYNSIEDFDAWAANRKSWIWMTGSATVRSKRQVHTLNQAWINVKPSCAA